jgi:hypothetical protein
MSENLCIRCGKVRVVAKTWKERVISYGKTSVVELTEMVCPDKKCQAQVEKDLAAQGEKTRQITQEREKRELDHRTKMVNLRLGKKVVPKKIN